MTVMSQVCEMVTHSCVDLRIDAAHLVVCERALQSLMRHRIIYPYLCELQQWFNGGSPTFASSGLPTLLLSFVPF